MHNNKCNYFIIEYFRLLYCNIMHLITCILLYMYMYYYIIILSLLYIYIYFLFLLTILPERLEL